MVTIKDLAVDWIQMRSALRQQIRKVESDPGSAEAGLPDDERSAIIGHLKSAMAQFDALLKEHPNA